jgi:hypothetical protein
VDTKKGDEEYFFVKGLVEGKPPVEANSELTTHTNNTFYIPTYLLMNIVNC